MRQSQFERDNKANEVQKHEISARIEKLKSEIAELQSDDSFEEKFDDREFAAYHAQTRQMMAAMDKRVKQKMKGMHTDMAIRLKSVLKVLGPQTGGTKRTLADKPSPNPKRRRTNVTQTSKKTNVRKKKVVRKKKTRGKRQLEGLGKRYKFVRGSLPVLRFGQCTQPT